MANESAAEPKKKGKGLLIGVLLAVFAIGGGASVPWLLGGQLATAEKSKKRAETKKHKLDAISFGDVAVNISGDHKVRFMRMKLMIAIDIADKREMDDVLTKQKPFLKNWLIGYLQEQHVADLIGKAAVNRIRREIRDRFNLMLYPDGEEKIVDILIDEYMVQ